MTAVTSVDPSTGAVVETVAMTTETEVEAIVQHAASAAPGLEALGREGRASLLNAVADELEARTDDIIEIGMRETGLPEPRLRGELRRTAYQARFFAEVVQEGSYLEATVDHASESPMGPGPDLRRLLVPIGPVAVFGASNFPLAFSVPGGDTVAALAAGSPVVVKAHSSHPALSRLTFEAVRDAAKHAGAPDGTIGIVFGTAAGGALVAHPAIKAVGFTGSLGGGRALMEIVNGREEPIPFYGELAGLNPVIITASAAAARTEEIATGVVTSVTGSGGQLCTKPGLVAVPTGDAGDALVTAIGNVVKEIEAPVLLNQRISDDYARGQRKWSSVPGTREIGKGHVPTAEGFRARPCITEVRFDDLSPSLLEECFGPAAVVVRYDKEEIEAIIDLLPSSLTGSIFAEESEVDRVRVLSERLMSRAGRLLYNQYPTGVHVSWAQHHGGPWPATNTLHTSVGATAIRRFLRPITWQNAPQALLPAELRDGLVDVPRRVDGSLQLP